MNFNRRLSALRLEMERQDVDLVVFGYCPNYQYLTGIKFDWRLAPDHRQAGDIVFIPRRGDPVLSRSSERADSDCPIGDRRLFDENTGYAGTFKAIVGGLPFKVGRLGLGPYLPTQAVAAAMSAAGYPETVDASRFMDAARMIKEPEEIEALRAVAKLTDEVMAKIVSGIREGTTQRELMIAMEAEAKRSGASGVSFEPWACFVASGSSVDGRLTDYPVDMGLRGNTAIAFDVGFVMDGYCSDWGRSVYWGKAPAHAAEAHAALRQATLETVALMKGGAMRASDLYPSIERALDRYGYGDYMRARLEPARIMGHQIGVEVHENPWLRPECDDMLRTGMVMCVEPKLWHAGEYYLRLEEMVYVGENGAEFLTDFDRELFEL